MTVTDYDPALKIAERICNEYASRFLCDDFFNSGYFAYFALSSALDKKATMRIASGDSCKAVRVDTIDGTKLKELTGRPEKISKLAAEYRGKRVAVSLSAPDGCGVREAYKIAEKIYKCFKDSELYDFVLIDKGESRSLIRSLARPDSVRRSAGNSTPNGANGEADYER